MLSCPSLTFRIDLEFQHHPPQCPGAHCFLNSQVSEALHFVALKCGVAVPWTMALVVLRVMQTRACPATRRCSWDCSVSPSSLLSGEQPGSSSHPSQSGGIWMAVVALTSSAFLGTPPFSCSENWVLWLSLNTLTELHFRAFISDLWGDKFLLWASTVLSSLIFFFFPNNS